ncbi:MAG: alkanesulfonate monooxygenase SsuD [Gammaproteobacteria bacterium]|jgi:alkanesulfonate monooxygenase SsuD/methylene tetrahydromethanopterin reductase-like flavin-dependent oxidoreductase (luciferase family)
MFGVPLHDKYQAQTTAGQEVSYLSPGMQQASKEGSIEVQAKDRFVLGDEHQVYDELQRYRAELGINHFCMRMHWFGLDQGHTLRSIERLGRVFSKLGPTYQR